MNNESFIWFGLLIFVVMPLFFWFRVSYLNKRRDAVKSVCSNCQSVQRLDKIKNYTCDQCGNEMNYLDEDGNLIQSETYECSACGTKNPVGIISCTGCNKELGKPI